MIEGAERFAGREITQAATTRGVKLDTSDSVEPEAFDSDGCMIIEARSKPASDVRSTTQVKQTRLSEEDEEEINLQLK